MILYEDLKKVNQGFTLKFKEQLSKFFDKGWYVLGEEVSKFEIDFAAYNNSNYCLGVANGLDALTLGLRVFDFTEGSEVIVPSNTYIATILSILNCGLIPVLVEPNVEDYLIDVFKIEKSITKNTVAIMPVHLYGRSCNMTEIIRLANKYGLKVIEDCAQSHGAIYKNMKVGTIGDIGAFSFYPTKNLGAIGDAGAILVKDYIIYEKLKSLRNYGSEKKYYNKYLGVNSRLDEIQALFLNIKLPYLDVINKHKQNLAGLYNSLINNDLIIKPDVKSEIKENVFHIYPIRSNHRNELKIYLEKNHIFTEIHYPIPPHLQEGYLKKINGKYPISEILHSTILSLPISFAHTEHDIKEVCKVINSFSI
jgi:dTDP-4-amino-4,6-dideoxygalactose transaminase